MFGRKTARVLDDTVNLVTGVAGRVAGPTGDRIMLAVANRVLGPVRERCDVDCTRCARGICEEH